MAGTDRKRAAVGAGPAIILVEPQLGENIGAAARAMLNCGLTDLRLVKPRDGWPNAKAVANASGADSVIEAARLFDSAEAAIADLERVYAIIDNLDAHQCEHLLFFFYQHPRWEFVYQPRYAAYLNLIEPWWKTLRSLALKGERFETWEQVVTAIEKATAYWNEHKHPFVWGRRRRHRPPRVRTAFSYRVKVVRI